MICARRRYRISGRRLGAALALILIGGGEARTAPPPLDLYGQLPNMELVRLSPGGDQIAYMRVTGADRKLFVESIDGKPLHNVDFHDIKLRDLEWADDTHVVASANVTMTFNRESSIKDEYLTVVTLNVPAHRLGIVFSGQLEVLPEVFGKFGYSQTDGHAYGFFGGIRHKDIELKGEAPVNLYRVDLDSGERVMIARGGALDEDWLIDPATGLRAAALVNDLKSGEWRVVKDDTVLARGRGDVGWASLMGFGRQTGSALILTPVADGGVTTSEIRLDGTGAADVPDSRHVENFWFDHRTGQWVGRELDADRPFTEFFDPAANARWLAARKAVGDGSGRLVSFSNDLAHMIVFTDGAGDAGTFWLVDGPSAAARPIGHAYPDISADQIGESRMVDWKAGDGMTLHGVLTLPPGKSAHALPLVVLPHGGPESRDYTGFDWWAQAFASRGYAVFQPNFRGSSGYGEEFVKAGYGQWGRKMQTDISDGVAALAASGVVDSHRACIVGASYGGYAALAGVTVQQGLYRCAVSWGGVADPMEMIRRDIDLNEGDRSDVTRYWTRFIGADSPGHGDMGEIAPLHLAARADAPILLMYGKDDTVVAPTQSRDMAAALRRASKPVDLVEMPGEDHWLSRAATRTQMLRAAVAFVQRYDPAD